MLTHYCARVDAYDVVAREGLSHKFHGLGVILLLVVGRHNHSSVQYKEVGIGSRQTVAIVVNSVGHGELEQTIRVAVGIGGSLKLLLKSLEVGILRVLLIITSYI